MEVRSSSLPFNVNYSACLDTRGTSSHYEGIKNKSVPRSTKTVDLLKLERLQYLNGLLANKLEGADLFREGCKLRECQVKEGLWMCLDCGKAFYAPITCKLRYCAHCAKQLSRKVSKEVYKLTSLMKEPKLLTLTMARTKDLKGGIQKIRKCFARWRRLSSIKRNLKGGIYHLEILPKDDGWHIHIHAIVDMPFIPKQVIYRTWAKALQQESASVDIQRISSLKAAYEVCKYITKISRLIHWSNSQLREFIVTTKNIRIYQTFGESFGIRNKVKEERSEESKASCPHCGSAASLYPARAGPVQFGKDWKQFSGALLGSLPDRRYMPGLMIQLELAV